jgi:uncharacterized damage-inducible protein DinB
MVAAPIADLYEGWDKHNSLLVRALSPLNAEQLSIKPAENMWSVRMIASHIVAVRAWWFHAWMDVGGEELAGFIDFDEREETSRWSSADIADGLQRSWSSLVASLASWTEHDLGQEFQRPVPNDEGLRPRRTRQYIIWHVAEHDVHHGGEISMILGSHGIPGLDL